MAYIFRRQERGGDYTPFAIDNKVIGHPDPIWSDFVHGRGLPDPVDHVLSATQLRQTSSRVPDILTVEVHHACSRRWRDFLEAWEPGVHMFKPLTLKRKNGEVIGEHYLWTVGQDIDCILTEGLAKFWQPERVGPPSFAFWRAVTQAAYNSKYPSKSDGTTIRISRPAVAGRHLWLGGYLGLGGRGSVQIFMSDEMYAAFRKEKLRVLDFECHVEEVEQPWVAEDQMGPLLGKWREREENIARHWPKVPPRHGNI